MNYLQKDLTSENNGQSPEEISTNQEEPQNPINFVIKEPEEICTINSPNPPRPNDNNMEEQ